MDSMQLLRSYRDDQPELSPDGFQALRERLEQHLDAAPVRRRPANRVRRGFAFGALGAAAAACVAVGVVAVGPAPMASAAAARLLQGAASTAQAGTGANGARTLVIREDALGIDGDTAVPMSVAYLGRTVTTLHVPAGGGEWTRSRYSLPTATFFGGAAARAFEKRDTAAAATKQNPAVDTSRDGSFTVGELGGSNDTVFGSDLQQLRQLPTDATALLKVLRSADLGTDTTGSEAEHVMTAATTVLDSGVADGDLQAAVFRALQQQPGLVVTDHSADLDGRSGVAIGVPAADERTETFQLILDPTTGQYLGHREISLTRTGVIPAGTVLDSTAITQQ